MPNFRYTHFSTGLDASNLPVSQGDSVSWIVFASGALIGYRIDFARGESPLNVPAVVVPTGGISPPQPVSKLSGQGYPYRITLSNLLADDQQIQPVEVAHGAADSHELSVKIIPVTFEGLDILLVPQITALAPGDLVVWKCSDKPTALTVAFNFQTPFKVAQNIIPNNPLAGATIGQQVDIRPGNFTFSVSVAGFPGSVRGKLQVRQPRRQLNDPSRATVIQFENEPAMALGELSQKR